MRILATFFVLLWAGPAVAEPGEWTRTEGKRGLAYFAESETADLTSGGHPNGVTLMLACFDGAFGAGLFLNGPEDEYPVTVSLMVDDIAPWQDQWSALEGTSDMAIGIWNPVSARAFANRIVAGQRLTVQMMHKGRPATYSYDLAKAGAYVEELVALCGTAEAPQ